jgi:hypothetical protein
MEKEYEEHPTDLAWSGGSSLVREIDKRKGLSNVHLSQGERNWCLYFYSMHSGKEGSVLKAL